MEIPFIPEVEKKLGEYAAETGRPDAASLVHDLVQNYIDDMDKMRSAGGRSGRNKTQGRKDGAR